MEFCEDLRRLKTGRRRGPRPVRVAARYVFFGAWRVTLSGMEGDEGMLVVGEMEGLSVIFVPIGVSRRRRVLLSDSPWVGSGFFNIG